MNKANGGDSIPSELFKILKDDAVKCCTLSVSKFGKQQWPQDWKRSVFIPIPKKGNAKECSNYHKINSLFLYQHGNALNPSSQASEVHELITSRQMYKLGLENAEEPEIKMSTFIGSQSKQRNFRKTYTASLTTLKPLTVWITTKWKILRDGSTRPPYLPPKVSVCRSRGKLEPNMEQQTGSKQEKEYIKAVYCHPAYLTYMQSTSCKMPSWMKHIWNQDCWEKQQ